MTDLYQVGRLGIAHGTHVHNGRALTIEGELHGTTLAELVAKRQAAIGLTNNPHEPTVPFTYTEDPSLDGYASPASVTIPAVPASLTALWLPITLTVELNGTAPVHESRSRGAVRTNDHAIDDTLTRTWHGTPAAYAGYFDAFTNRDEQTRESATGDVKVWQGGTGAGRNHYLDSIHGYYVAPADHYDGAAELRIDDVAQVGDVITNAPTDWELTNGIVGIRPDPGASAGRLNLRLYDPATNGYAAASDARDFVLGHFSGGSFHAFTNNPHTITVIRNRPELVQIRLTYTGPVVGALTSEFAYSVDLLLRRGANYIEGYLDGLGTVANWGINRDAAEAMAALTGGIRANADDAQGHRYIVATPAAFTTITSGLYATVTAVGLPFALGMEIATATAAKLDTAQNTIYAYHAAHYERTRIVAR